MKAVVHTKIGFGYSGFLPKRKFRCLDICFCDMELDRIRAWQLFIETSRLGSLALAAEALSFPLPKASRLISSLEDELGFLLLDRTKKPAALTKEGQALVLDAQGLISQWGILRERAEALRNGNFELSRRSLRISLPVNMDRSVFFEALQNLPIKHPDLQLEFCADVGQQALLEGKADIAWFGYKPEERGLVAIPMGYNVSFLVASAKYLKSHAEIRKVSDLINHPIIMRDTGNESFSQVLQCEYSNYEIGRDHKVLYGDSDACKKLLIEGKGIAIDMNPNFIAEELLDGTVQPVLPGWHRKPWALHICCRKSSSKDPIIREAMGIIRYLALHQEPNDWKSWYRRLHLPEQMVLLPKV